MRRDWLYETHLESKNVKLIPMTTSHAEQLIEAVEDGKLWDIWYTGVPHQDSVHNYIDQALAEQARGKALAFVVFHKASQKIIGSTRYCNADSLNKRLEIGYTWYSQSYQKTSVNTECKLLLLEHAFEKLESIAVEFRTHWHNHKSRIAIARLGAKQDGILRNHQKDEDGCYRDTVVFSIINHEWPVVRKSLEYKLTSSGRKKS